MVIRRNVGDFEIAFVLSPSEMCEAFYEQQHIFDMDDVRAAIEGLTDDGCKMAWEVTVDEFKELVPKIATEMRRLMEKWDMEWTYARDEAISTIVGEYLEAKSNAS